MLIENFSGSEYSICYFVISYKIVITFAVCCSSILSYFNFAPAPFERFSGKQAMVSTFVMIFLRNNLGICFWVLPSNVLCFQVEPHKLLHVARISYRFLLVEPEIFSKLWDWSCFLDLIEEPCKPDLTWCMVQILSVVLKLSCRATESLNVEAEEAFSCLLRSVLFTSFWLYVILKMQCMFNDNLQLAVFSWEEFCCDTSLEKAGWFVEPIADYVSGSPDRSIDFNQENCLMSFRFNSHPVSSPKLHELQPPLRSQRLTTGYIIFYSKLKHSYFDLYLLCTILFGSLTWLLFSCFQL